jgi:hypothetical protein
LTTRLHGPGPIGQSASVDENGHRTYSVTFRVISDDRRDGPARVLQTPGLPLPGSWWVFGNDVDVYAWCRPTRTVTRAAEIKENHPALHWNVACEFSTRPPTLGGGTSTGRPGGGGDGGGGNRRGCHEQQIEDPLLEPMGISGSWIERSEIQSHDRHGAALVYSSWEPIEGADAEFPIVNPTVVIEQNVTLLQNDLCTSMLNTLNDRPLWGLPARVWRLKSFDWEQKFYGLCYPYYVRKFVFEAAYRWVNDPEAPEIITLQPAWDHTVADKSNMVLNGHWGRGTVVNETGTGLHNEGNGWVLDPMDEAGDIPPDPLNPTHFIRAHDRQGRECPLLLNGRGMPHDPDDAARAFWWVYTVNPTGGAPSAQRVSGTFAYVKGLVGVLTNPRIFGPFYTEDQATTAELDAVALNKTQSCGKFPKAGCIKIQKSAESNFLLLGVPISL